MKERPKQEGDLLKRSPADEAAQIFMPGELTKTLSDDDLEQRRIRVVPTRHPTDHDANDDAIPPLPPVKPGRTSKRRADRARERQLTYLNKRRRQKKRHVLYWRLRQLLKLCTGVFFLMVIAQFVNMNIWTLDQPRLVLLNQQLIEKSHIQPIIDGLVGKPIYAIDPHIIAKKLKSEFPLIDNLYVRRYLFPARVELFVVEKQPWAEVYTADTGASTVQVPDNATPGDATAPLASNTHAPFALLTSDENLIPLDQYNLHYDPRRYPAGSIHKVIFAHADFKPDKTFLKRLDKLTYKLSHAQGLHFQAIIVDDPDNIRARYDETEVLIGRPDAGVYRRADRLNALVPKVLELKDQIAAVDLRWSDQVTFHKK